MRIGHGLQCFRLTTKLSHRMSENKTMTTETTPAANAVGDERLVRFSVDDLKAFAGARCRDIYNDFTEDEAKRQPRSVFLAWEVGRNLFLHYDYIANAEVSGAKRSDH